MHQLELAYLGIEVPDPPSLTPFFGDVIGLVPGEPDRRRRARPGATTTRPSGSSSQPGPANDAVVRRLRGGRRRRLRRDASRASRAAGFAVDRGHRRRAAPPAGSRGWPAPTAPWGVPVELVARARATPPTPFASPLVPGGFLTDGVGFGHVVFATTAFDESHAFLVDGLGLAQSDWLEMEIAAGIELEVRFYHCNERHHTLALARAPFELPQTLHHLMFETQRPRRRRRRVRPGVGHRLADPQRARPPRQRRHVQLLRRRARPASRSRSATAPASITDDWDDNRRYDRISAWGHQPLRQA